jgi:hypothetical protein
MLAQQLPPRQQRQRARWHDVQRITAIVMLTILTACASSSKARPTRDVNIITRDQVLAGNYATALDVVRGLHPNWLIKRGRSSAASAPGIVTFVDGVAYGDVSWLKNVQSSTIESIQRIDPGTATTRWGTGYSEGVIYVTSYKRPPNGPSAENR